MFPLLFLFYMLYLSMFYPCNVGLHQQELISACYIFLFLLFMYAMFPLLLFYLLFPSIYYPEMLYFRFVYNAAVFS
jgi:hypothetical protein